MKNGYYFLLIVILISCHKKDNEILTAIQGKWIGIDYIDIKSNHSKDPSEPPPPPPLPPISYDELNFLGKDSLKCYFTDEFISNYFAYTEGFTTIPYDYYQTQFKIIANELMILRRDSSNQKKWISKGKIEVRNDTLYLKDESKILVFIRLKSINNYSFDEISFYSSGCFGRCPTMYILLRKDNSYIYHGERHVLKKGGYVGELDKELIDRIWLNFQRFKVDTLDNYYAAGHTDDETIQISFIKDDKIIKTIYDYGHASPQKFGSSYSYIKHTFAYRDYNVSDKVNEPVIENLIIDFNFRKEKTSWRTLLSSESYWLLSKFRKAKIINSLPNDIQLDYSFEKMADWQNDKENDFFSITLSDGNLYSIRNTFSSDGRFFKFTTTKGERILLDITTNLLTPYILNRPLSYPYAPFFEPKLIK